MWVGATGLLKGQGVTEGGAAGGPEGGWGLVVVER